MSFRPPDWDAKAIVQGITHAKGILRSDQIVEAATDAILKALERYGVKAEINFYGAHQEFDTLGNEYVSGEQALSVKLRKMGYHGGTRGLLAFIPEEVKDDKG